MRCIERFRQYRDGEFDEIMCHIEEGVIRCGRYARGVKVKPNTKVTGREFFKNAKSNRKRKQ